MGWSNANKVGLVLLAICAAANMVPVPVPDGAPAGPPLGVLIANAVLGLIAVIAIVHAWRTDSRRFLWLVITVSVINLLLALPAFVVDGVPDSIQVIVAIYTAVSVLGLALTLKPNRPASAA